jgi:hypothetical protein
MASVGSPYLIKKRQFIMAKVTGPLMSMSASGKLGDAIVFSIWKGAAYVRQFVIPANPQSADQGDVRVIMGGLGRACGKVSVGSEYAGQLETLSAIPSGQSKQSFLVKYIRDHYLASASVYNALESVYDAHTAFADFESAGEDLGIADFDLSYAGTAETFEKGFGVYLLAKAAIDLGFTGTPYSVALADWTSTEIDALVSDMASA